MKQSCITILCFLLFFSLSFGAEAQIFDFGFDTPFIQRRQTQRESVSPPKFKGGNEGINRFIKKNFRSVGLSSVNGQIVVAFIINEKGKVTETAIVRGLDQALNEEAQRVVGKLKFKPARQGKKKVKYQYDVTFPIRHGKVSFLTAPTVDM